MFQCNDIFLAFYIGDGKLNILEFIDLMEKENEKTDKELELIEAFRAFDTEDTGTKLKFPAFAAHHNKRCMRFYNPRFYKMRFETFEIHKKTTSFRALFSNEMNFFPNETTRACPTHVNLELCEPELVWLMCPVQMNLEPCIVRPCSHDTGFTLYRITFHTR